ncbi:MAG: hypothetical protein NC217_08765 [Muribaculaceae bacterium]|nr:hypothetical protein [Muribaculaceae bacterium]
MKNIRTSQGRGVRVALIYSILLFAAAWCIWALCTPLLGDDIMTVVKLQDTFGGGLYGCMRYAWTNWLHINARMGDLFSPLLLGVFPRWLVALAIGAAVLLTMWGIFKLGSLKQKAPLISAITIAVSLMALPWWNMTYYVCHFNYVWGTALISIVLVVVFHKDMSSRRWLWGVPLAFIATSTHEALGFPLGCGLLMFWYINKRRIHLTGAKKWWVIAILAGAIFCITSPASYNRALAGNPPDLSPLMMIIKVLPMVVLLLLRVIYLWIRHRLSRLLHTRWLIFATAAIVSSCFTMIGGIEGRGGWYAEFFAIIALAFDFAHNPILHTLSWRWRNISGMVIALGCNAFAIWFGLTLMEQTGNRQQMVSYYSQIPDMYTTIQQFGADEDEWALRTLPLLYGAPIQATDGSIYFTPTTPLLLMDPNPMFPLISV